jgi:hypothetical protein
MQSAPVVAQGTLQAVHFHLDARKALAEIGYELLFVGEGHCSGRADARTGPTLHAALAGARYPAFPRPLVKGDDPLLAACEATFATGALLLGYPWIELQLFQQHRLQFLLQDSPPGYHEMSGQVSEILAEERKETRGWVKYLTGLDVMKQSSAGSFQLLP